MIPLFRRFPIIGFGEAVLLATPDFVMTSNRNALRRGARGGFMTDADIAVRSGVKIVRREPIREYLSQPRCPISY